MDDERREQIIAALRGCTYNELVAAMIAAQENHKQMKDATSAMWDEVCLVARKIIPERMDNDQIQNITVILPDGSKKQLLCIDQVSVKTPAENKGALYEWLHEHDAESIISETVNSSTLAAFVRQQMAAGDDYPVDICEINAYSTASLRKAS